MPTFAIHGDKGVADKDVGIKAEVSSIAMDLDALLEVAEESAGLEKRREGELIGAGELAHPAVDDKHAIVGAGIGEAADECVP